MSHAEEDPEARVEHAPDRPAGSGLCPRCDHVRVVRSERGSVFLRCGLASHRPGFAKYPPQPVLSCPGWTG